MAKHFFVWPFLVIFTYKLKNMAKKNKHNKPNEDLNGLSDRHVGAIIRRKMITRDHGDGSVYNRKNKNWKKDINGED